MSTALLTPRRYKPKPRLLTAAQFADLPERLDGQWMKYELYRGELIIMVLPGGKHGRKQARATYFLTANAEEQGLGVAYGEVGVLLQRDPDTVLGPDAAFVLKASLPVKYTPEGYLETIPEIMIEIRSKNESDPELRAKAQEYFTAGAKEFWRLESKTKTMLLMWPGGRERKLSETETLTSDLLPGFAVPVSQLFVE